MSAALTGKSNGTQGALIVTGVEAVVFDVDGIVSGYKDQSIAPSKLTQKPTLVAPVPTTSGTTINLAGIPAWANRVTLGFAGVSTSGSSYPIVRLNGQSTGYNAGSSVGTTYSAFTDGFGFSGSLASNSISGALVFSRQSGNTWCCQGSVQSAGITWSISGSVNLSAALSSIALTTQGSTDTFDVGSVSILYEG